MYVYMHACNTHVFVILTLVIVWMDGCMHECICSLVVGICMYVYVYIDIYIYMWVIPG